MSSPRASNIPIQNYPNLESHLAAIVEKYTGMACMEWMSFEVDLIVGDLIKNEIILDCFEAFCPGFTPGEGDVALAMECDTVEDLIHYFESICDDPRSTSTNSDFRFNFSV